MDEYKGLRSRGDQWAWIWPTIFAASVVVLLTAGETGHYLGSLGA